MSTTHSARTVVTDEQITARYACNCTLVAGVHAAGQCAHLRTHTDGRR
jgi:hypothetical protein